MIYIKKEAEPEWLTEVKAHNKGLTYDAPEFAPYRETLRKELIREQKNVCAYCCGKIDMDSAHNEHIEPQNWKNGRKSTRSLDYDNIVASCNGFHGEETCGKHKDNEHDADKFVSPLHLECEEQFVYYPNGMMEGNEYTIDLLNLNSYQLRKAREATYKTLIAMDLDKEIIKQMYLDDEEEYWAFVNVIRWYVNHDKA